MHMFLIGGFLAFISLHADFLTFSSEADSIDVIKAACFSLYGNFLFLSSCLTAFLKLYYFCVCSVIMVCHAVC